uniref:Shugoshin C-terminal domain-containing protein n=1 Tax=Anolis carolinensis TaxID=28377 RepID=A0A803TJM9_ANOCA
MEDNRPRATRDRLSKSNMVRERCLKKSFKDTLEDIKERMKEKRNNKWAKLGKTSQVLTLKAKITDNSSVQLKSFQENNRALALALEVEKGKVKDAQDIILHLKREYQHLKFQVMVLQRKLGLQQEKEYNESKLLTVKKIISKVVQDLLCARNHLSPANDQYTTDFNELLCPPVLEKHDSSNLRNKDYMPLLRRVLPADVSKQDKTHETKNKNASEGRNASVTMTSQTDTGWQNSSCEFHLDFEGQIDNSLPKNVSTRRRHLGITNQNELLICVDNNTRITEQITDPWQQDETGFETRVEENNEQCEETSVCKENTHEINSDQNLELSDMLTETNTMAAATKQTEFKNSGNVKTQKRKLETLKNASKSKSKKKRSHNEEHCSKERADASLGSSDAYDFMCEESVHLTPFRQNKENENKADDKNHIEDKTETCSSDSFLSEDDSDDSLYLPCIKKSKPRKQSCCESVVSPVHRRPRLNKMMSEQHDKNPDKKNSSAKQDENCLDKKNVPDEPPSSPQERLHLGNITNLASSSSSYTRASHSLPSAEEKPISNNRRRCTISVSYKEPSISRKLRRGDPYTDTDFLNSPIFKEKRIRNIKKKSLSRYNEAFVGYR